MTRVNVFSYFENEYDGQGTELAGWFDPAKADRFEQDRIFDGDNVVGVLTGSPWIDEYLYRTKGGRWVRNLDQTRYHSGPDRYEFYTDEQAKDWLLRSGNHDDVIVRYFGEVEEEKGPGRPGIGAPLNVRLGELHPAVARWAEQDDVKMAEWVRRAVESEIARRTASEVGAG